MANPTNQLTPQQASGSGTGTAVITIPGATKAYDLLIVTAYGNTSSTFSIADNISGTWSSPFASGVLFGTSNKMMTLFYKLAVGTETSVTLSASGSTILGHFYEYQNVSPNVDSSNSATSGTSVSSQSTGAISTANANDLIFTSLAKPGSGGAGDSWATATIEQDGTNLFDGQNIVTSTQTNYSDTASWTSGAVAAAALIVAFKSWNRVTIGSPTMSTTDTYATHGTYYWAPNSGTTVSQVQLWGAGGGGGGGGSTNAGGGGGGGEYRTSVVPVTSGTGYTIVVGTGGAGGSTGSGSAGTNSTFNSTSVVASGGGAGTSPTGGAGGTGGTGSTSFSGGAGATSTLSGGAGGGGSAGTAANGNAGSANTGNTGGAGATAVTGGGAGGAGGNATSSAGSPGSTPSSNPGGGGGGGGEKTTSPFTEGVGGQGADGQAILSYGSNTGNFMPFFR